jgi:hypothetical protein
LIGKRCSPRPSRRCSRRPRPRRPRLHVGDVHAVARGGVAVDVDVDVAPAGQPLGQRAGDAGHVLEHALDLAGEPPVDLARSVPATLTPTGLLMPVASMSMRLRIGGTQMLARPGTLHDAVQLLDQLVRRHAGRHSSRGLNWIVVSNISSGAGSVAVSARPALP